MEGYTLPYMYSCNLEYLPIHAINLSHSSGQIIATSAEVTLNCGLVREIPLFQWNLGWWNIIIWPDSCRYQCAIFQAPSGWTIWDLRLFSGPNNGPKTAGNLLATSPRSPGGGLHIYIKLLEISPEVDYEKSRTLQLGHMFRNEIALHSGII